MKEIRYIPVVMLLLQPVVGSAHNPGENHSINGNAEVTVDAPLAAAPSALPRPHAPHNGENINVVTCPWDRLDAEARAALWPTLSARHRDYHWRLMNNDERAALRTCLPKIERRRLRERFVMNHNHAGENDRPYVLYKRLSKEELSELREQVRQANKQIILSSMLKTPAQIEYEDQFLSKMAELNALKHQMLVITIQDKERGSIDTASSEDTAPKIPSTRPEPSKALP